VGLDTNVFVSSAWTPRRVRGQILDAAHAEDWTVVVSEQLLDALG
jgi:predicted nucleic acid-binding protein